MDNIFFYWISWFFWIIVTFLMAKGKVRTILAFFLLLLISFSQMYITIFRIEINLAFILIVLCSFTILTIQNRMFYKLFLILFVAYSYTGSRLWEIVNPIWIFIPRSILYGFIFAFVSILCGKNLLERFLISSLTISLGEIIYVLIVHQIGWVERIGNSEILNLISLQAGIIFGFYIFKEIKFKMEVILQQIEQQKKGWTNE